ncbi:hypothetical protein pdam_00024764 [Pocillopora damicornis]|uniref:FLYWCH-type domain-containing protein n=1 Tax=Pocillopora damicornis TaxID=46731 RepID=A0A3M6UPD3_POCDA|nr:hypothetical protein pdam_00024764 [Pocillopora damicornis]
MSDNPVCMVCNTPVVDSEDAWFLGWLDNHCMWQHKACENENLIGQENASLGETSIDDPTPSSINDSQAVGLSLNIVREGSQRKKARLIDSQGFTYNVSSRRPYATYWQCTVRPKGNYCKASVI